jgi:hypothetical protein
VAGSIEAANSVRAVAPLYEVSIVLHIYHCKTYVSLAGRGDWGQSECFHLRNKLLQSG